MKPKKKTHPLGATLTEALLCLGVLGTLATIGVSAVTSIRGATRHQKLENDVHQLNLAVMCYYANGGRPEDLKDAETVLLRLKQTRPDDDSRRYVGAAHNRLIDTRLSFRPLTGEEARAEGKRAYWDPEETLFKITEERRPGIREFWFDDRLAGVDFGVDPSRKESMLTYADRANWIWDFQDRTASYQEGSTEIAFQTPSFTTPPGGGGGGEWTPPSGPGSGGLALNVGSGTATASDGVAVNLLSDDISAGRNEVALGVLGNEVRFGGMVGKTVNAGTSHLAWQEATHGRGGAGSAVALGDGHASASDGVAATVGHGSAEAVNGWAANVGDGHASGTNGAAVNVGSGSAAAGSAGND